MEHDSRVLIAIAGEDQAHRVLATALVDEVVLERASGGWPEREELWQVRVFCGWQNAPDAPEPERYYPFQTLAEDLRAQMPRRFFRVNRIGDQPAGEATWFISLYQLFALRTPRPRVLFGMRDTNDPALSAQADRAVHYIRERLDPETIVIFGLPYRDAEAWFVAGLDTPRAAAAREALGFDPQAEPHRLTAEPNTALTDAKRVLRFLPPSAGDHLRESVGECQGGARPCPSTRPAVPLHPAGRTPPPPGPCPSTRPAVPLHPGGAALHPGALPSTPGTVRAARVGCVRPGASLPAPRPPPEPDPAVQDHAWFQIYR